MSTFIMSVWLELEYLTVCVASKGSISCNNEVGSMQLIKGRDTHQNLLYTSRSLYAYFLPGLWRHPGLCDVLLLLLADLLLDGLAHRRQHQLAVGPGAQFN